MAKYPISAFKHRVAVCSMKDVVLENDGMSLSRQDVYHCWASITPSVKTLYSGSGNAVKQSRDVRTHQLVVRFRRDIDFTQAAWFYDERLQSGGRWFKLLAMVEAGENAEYLECDVRLVERGFAMSAPAPADEPQQGASLMRPAPTGAQL